MRKRLKVLTVGCKANFADSASVVRTAVAEGFEVVSPSEPADVVIINSCTVTHRADRDSRSLARRERRANPGRGRIPNGRYGPGAGRRREAGRRASEESCGKSQGTGAGKPRFFPTTPRTSSWATGGHS